MMKQTITKIIFLTLLSVSFLFAQGVELISNNDFEAGLDGWELYNLEADRSSLELDDSGIINGISAKINVFTPYKGYPSGRIAFFTKVEIDSGETYNISFKIRSDKVIDGNGIWWCLYDSVETATTYSGMWGQVTLGKETTVTYEDSFTANFTNHGIDFSLDLAAIGVDSVTLWIDDISLTKVIPPDPNKPLGSGTEADPYQIATLGNLSWFAQGDSAAWVAHYIQTADIDASATQYWDDSDDDGDGNKYNDPNDLTADGTNEGFFPIGGKLGSSWVRFTNSYDGQGHVIDGLYINRPTTTRVAFLGYAGDAANKATKISNLGLTNVNITGKDNVGALVGKFRQGDEITNCYSTGVVNGVNLIGGLVGECRENSSITKSYSSAAVTSTGVKVGGLVGYFYGGSGIISECYATGSVEGDQIGGFVGRTYKAHIQNCYSSTTIIPASGSSAYGAFGNEISEASTIENCYAIGDAGTEDGHGFVRVSYNAASTFTNNFFDTETTHQTTAGSSTGGADGSAIGKTTADMKTEATFTGWDFATTWEVNSNYPNLVNNSNPDLLPVPLFPGSGTEADPYQIATLADLQILTQHSEEWEKYFVQTADIDASATATWDDTDDDADGNKYNDANDLTADGTNEGWLPIGELDEALRFKGNYNGNGYTISGLTVNRTTDNVGFFGVTGYTGHAKIYNLSLENVNITGANQVGGFVGYLHNSMVIDSCAVNGGSVTGTGRVGGFVGRSDNGAVAKNSSVTGGVTVSGEGPVGGFVGRIEDTSDTLRYCSSDVEVVCATGTIVGGFVGKCYGAVSESYSDGSVNVAGGNTIGGFAGKCGSAGSIINCYTLSDVSRVGGGHWTFGFCEINQGTIENSYAAGTNDNGSGARGFLKENTGTSTGNFYDSDTYGGTGSVGATAKTTAEMKTETTFTDSSWDFASTWKINGNYPNLINNSNPDLLPLPDPNKPVGSGTESDPYLVSSIENLKWMGENVSAWGAYYLQTNNINAAVTATWNDGKGFLPIGDNHQEGTEWYDFKGVYDGAGFVIDSLYISRKDQDIVGLFGSTQKNGGAIKNLGLTNVNIRGKDKVGGLSGKSRNTFLIENCYVTGNIAGNSLVGGLVGELYNGAHIENCYTKDGVVNGAGQGIGGFVGKVRWHATISKCYSLMNVDCYAAEYIGGFSGWIRDEVTAIEKCYSMGNVVTTSGRFAGGFTGVNQSKSKITNCYSLSNVTAGSIAFGFCGYSDGDTIKYSYSAANTSSEGFTKIIGSHTSEGNFFDEEASGSTSGAGAVGKTTAEMKTLATYTDASWDFSNVWKMDGASYPTLQGVYAPEISNELPLPEGGIELLSNNYFNDGMSNWNFSAQGNAEALESIDSTGALDGKHSGKVAITKQGDGKYNWEIEMSQLLPGGIKAGKMYHIQYQAKASKEATLETWIQQWHNPFDPIYASEMVLTTEAQTFVDTFYVSESDSLVVWAFAYGAMGDNIDVWVDAVHVIEFAATDVRNTENMVVKEFALEQNYPNPFNPTTVINFSLPKASDVQLSVYNILGEKITELVNGKMVAGNHSVNFNATNLASGMYIYRIQAGNFVSVKKMMLLK